MGDVEGVAAAAMLLIFVPHAVLLWRADISEHRLPNRIVASLALCCTGAGALLALTGARVDFGFALAAGAVTAVVAIGLALVVPAALGMGDAKLTGAIAFAAALFGPWYLIVALVTPLLLGGGIGSLLLVAGRTGAKDPIPFGPFLLLGFPVALAVAPLVAPI